MISKILENIQSNDASTRRLAYLMLIDLQPWLSTEQYDCLIKGILRSVDNPASFFPLVADMSLNQITMWLGQLKLKIDNSPTNENTDTKEVFVSLYQAYINVLDVELAAQAAEVNLPAEITKPIVDALHKFSIQNNCQQ